MAWHVVEVTVEATHPLREKLLRRDRSDLSLHMPDDDVPCVFHLTVRDPTGDAIWVASLMPTRPSFPATPPAWRLRQMAVDSDYQRSGVGSALFADAVLHLRDLGAATLWAESRDTSLDFYLAHGMIPVPGRHHTVGVVAYTDVMVTLA